MKKLVFVSAALLMLVLSSCGNGNEETMPSEVTIPTESHKILASYLGEDFEDEFNIYPHINLDGDYKDETNTAKAAILGVKNGHLWLGIFNVETKKKVFEWTDANSFEYHRTINKGYGEYREVDVSKVELYSIIQTSKGYLLNIHYNNGEESYFAKSYSLYSSNLEKLDYSIYERWFDDYILCKKDNWLNDIVVSPEGEILEGFTIVAIKELKETELLSFCEGIKLSDLTFSRIKYEQTIWKTKYNPDFEVESNTMVESKIIEKDTDTWMYRLVFTYYSGEKKTVDLILNINDGTITKK